MSTRRQSVEYHCKYLDRIVNNTVLRRTQLVRPRRLYLLAPRVQNPDGRQILQHRREKIKGLRWRQYVSPKRLYVNVNYSLVFNSSYDFRLTCATKKVKAVPLHAMKSLGGRGGIAPTHSRPRH
jgi:hypothetical protein